MYTLDDYRRDLVAMLHSLSETTEIPRWLPVFRQGAAQVSANRRAVRAEWERVIKIIDAITPLHRRFPAFIDAAARERIARDAHVDPEGVEQLLCCFQMAAEFFERSDPGQRGREMP